MSNETDWETPEDAVVSKFVDAYQRSNNPPATLSRFCEDFPHLADRFQRHATFEGIIQQSVPRAIPGITLEAKLGSGGMGSVYAGSQDSLRRPVAVKLCPIDALQSDRDDFHREHRFLARLYHTSIVPVHTAGRFGNWLYFVMPRIQGVNGAEYLTRARAAVSKGNDLANPKSLITDGSHRGDSVRRSDRIRLARTYFEFVASVMENIGSAVQSMHDRGIRHLDIKPANFMIEPSGSAVLIDVGVARDARDDADGKSTDVPLTRAYASVERLDGDTSPQTDNYSLGVVLYEMLTLRQPFVSADDLRTGQAACTVTNRQSSESPIGKDIERSIRRGDCPAPKRLVQDLPRDLSAICMRAMARRPEDRYARADELVADLRRWREGRETTARHWSMTGRFSDWIKRHRPLSAFIGATMIFAVLYLFARVQVSASENKQIKLESDYLLTQQRLFHQEQSVVKSRMWGTLELVRDRLDDPSAGRREEVLQLLGEIARDRRSLPADDLDGPIFDTVMRSRFVESLTSFEISPEQVICPLPVDAFQCWHATIHPDGKSAVIGTADRPLLWKRDGPKPTVAAADAKKRRSTVQFDPSGKLVVERRAAETGGGLRIWDREVGQMLREIIPPDTRDSAVREIGWNRDGSILFAGTHSGKIRVFRIHDFTELPDRKFPEIPPENVSAYAFDGPRGYGMVGSRTGQVVVFDADGNVRFRHQCQPAKEVQSARFSHRSELLAVGTTDGSMHMFTRDGSHLYRMPVTIQGVERIVFDPTDTFVTANFRNEPMRIWVARTGRLVLFHSSESLEEFAADGRRFLRVALDGVRFGELSKDRGIHRITGLMSWPTRSTWARSAPVFAALDTSWQIQVGRADRQGEIVCVVSAPGPHGFWPENGDLALSPDGKLLAFASGGQSQAKAAIWNVADGRLLQEWTLPGGFDRLTTGSEPGEFISIREEIGDNGALCTTVKRRLVVGKPLPEPEVIRKPQPQDRRRYISGDISSDGTKYLWAGPRQPFENRRIEVYDLRTNKLLRMIPALDEKPTDGTPICNFHQQSDRFVIHTENPPFFREVDLTTNDPPKTVARRFDRNSPDRKWATAGHDFLRSRHRSAIQVLRNPGGEVWIEIPYLRGNGQANLNGDCFSFDSRYLVLSGGQDSLVLLDLPELQKTLQEYEEFLRRAAESAVRPK